jgi:hypothetical protein
VTQCGFEKFVPFNAPKTMRSDQGLSKTRPSPARRYAEITEGQSITVHGTLEAAKHAGGHTSYNKMDADVGSLYVSLIWSLLDVRKLCLSSSTSKHGNTSMHSPDTNVTERGHVKVVAID